MKIQNPPLDGFFSVFGLARSVSAGRRMEKAEIKMVINSDYEE